MNITPYSIAETFVGTKEVKGIVDNPFILAMLRIDDDWPEHDEVPWCSGFANFIAKMCRVSRSYSLLARSWLTVGVPIQIGLAQPGFDVVILSRGEDAPGPEVIDAPGHVGFFSSRVGKEVHILGGNQGDMVSVAPFDIKRVLGVRRLVG